MDDIQRDISLNMVRVTEVAALRASRYLGLNDKNAADQAAVDGMRGMLDLVNIRGRIVIGEGRRTRRPCSISESRWATGTIRNTLSWISR